MLGLDLEQLSDKQRALRILVHSKPSLVARGPALAVVLGEISVTVLLYSAKWKTITIAIYEYLLGNDIAKASALGTITIFLTLCLVAGASRLVGRNMADMFR